MRPLRISVFAGLIMALVACGQGDGASAGKPGGGFAQMPPPEVAVLTLAPVDVTQTRELPARLSAARVAEVRARVEGVLERRVYTEGSDVNAGQVLFQIDKRPLEASRQQARAQLTRAEAEQATAQATLARYKPLRDKGVLSQQQLDDADARSRSAVADVAAARATLAKAELDLSYASVTAPISGRIGRAHVTEGALVRSAEATALATIEQMDTVYADFSVPSMAMLALRRALADQHGVLPRGTPVALRLEDGSAYAVKGRLDVAEMTVDPATGQVGMRAVFANPHRELLPGMYVRVRLPERVLHQVLAVPVQAVMRTSMGGTVQIVNDKGLMEVRAVRIEADAGEQLVLAEGVRAGDRIIVVGGQKVQPGMPVKALPWSPKITPAVAAATKRS